MRLILRTGLGILVILIGLGAFAYFAPMTASRFVWPVLEAIVLDEPFVGITTDGAPEPGLFTIESTGVSTAPVVQSARRFIATLSDEQQARVMFPVDDLEWRRWANVHISTRQGVGFVEYDEEQAQAAFDLIASGLSARGFRTARDIMRLEGHLADLKNNNTEYGEQRYWLTIMGEPSATEPWGWQLDGHHLIINFFVLGDQVVMTPTFMGSEPPRADTGRYAGTSILDDELSAGLALINSLDDEQRLAAVLATDKTANNNRGELFRDNAVVPYQGLPLARLTSEQNRLALELVSLYVDQMRPGHAEVRMAEILRHWHDTRFAWVGETTADAVFYYRIHSPVVLIEYDHQLPVALPGPSIPTRDHVHTVVRTPNGNDYGKDLLAQHLSNHPH
jgi:hypothetical protein